MLANKDSYEIVISGLKTFGENLYAVNEKLKKQSENMYDAMEGDDYSRELCNNVSEFTDRIEDLIHDIEAVRLRLLDRVEEVFGD